MLSFYSLKCQKIQKVKIQNLQAQLAVYDSKKLKFIKEKEASGLLSSLAIKTPLSKIPLVSPLLF